MAADEGAVTCSECGYQGHTASQCETVSRIPAACKAENCATSSVYVVIKRLRSAA